MGWLPEALPQLSTYDYSLACFIVPSISVVAGSIDEIKHGIAAKGWGER
jgi:hypothetical protein